MHVALIYPHQLFANHPALTDADACVLVEEPLLFKQFRFHAQKLVLHRAAMQTYAARLRAAGMQVRYVESRELTETADIAAVLEEMKAGEATVVDVSDDWLDERLRTAVHDARIPLTVLDDPHFLTPHDTFADLTANREKFFFTDFYIAQRKRLGLLLDESRRPLGGRWSFDAANRKKLPRDAAHSLAAIERRRPRSVSLCFGTLSQRDRRGQRLPVPRH